MSSTKPTANITAAAMRTPLGLRVASEERVEGVHQAGRGERDDEAGEHGDAADVGGGHLVDPPIVGFDHPAQRRAPQATIGVATKVTAAAIAPISR